MSDDKQRWNFIDDELKQIVGDRLKDVLEHSTREDNVIKAASEVRQLEAMNQRDEHFAEAQKKPSLAGATLVLLQIPENGREIKAIEQKPEDVIDAEYTSRPACTDEDVAGGDQA